MAKSAQKSDFPTWSIQNFVKKVKQFAKRYYTTSLTDLANKLYGVEKFLDFILCPVLLNIVSFFQEILPTNVLNKIQPNSFYINMWLSSLNIFEENQFYEIKKRNIYLSD